VPIGYPDFFRRVRIKAVDTEHYIGDKKISPKEYIFIAGTKGYDCEIESLEISLSDDIYVIILLYSFDKDGKQSNAYQIPLTTSTKSETRVPNPSNIRTYKSNLFDLLVDDAATGHFKVALKRKLRFPHGFYLQIYNSNPTDSYYAAWQLVVSRYSLGW